MHLLGQDSCAGTIPVSEAEQTRNHKLSVVCVHIGYTGGSN